jgi:hypothetical protein
VVNTFTCQQLKAEIFLVDPSVQTSRWKKRKLVITVQNYRIQRRAQKKARSKREEDEDKNVAEQKEGLKMESGDDKMEVAKKEDVGPKMESGDDKMEVAKKEDVDPKMESGDAKMEAALKEDVAPKMEIDRDDSCKICGLLVCEAKMVADEVDKMMVEDTKIRKKDEEAKMRSVIAKVEREHAQLRRSTLDDKKKDEENMKRWMNSGNAKMENMKSGNCLCGVQVERRVENREDWKNWGKPPDTVTFNPGAKFSKARFDGPWGGSRADFLEVYGVNPGRGSPKPVSQSQCMVKDFDELSPVSLAEEIMDKTRGRHKPREIMEIMSKARDPCIHGFRGQADCRGCGHSHYTLPWDCMCIRS